MDSINKNQPEDNFENLFGSEGIEKIKSLASKAGSCFMCTKIETGNSFSARPMAPEKVDDQGNFWFLSANDSHKNVELEKDPSVQLLFQGSSYSDFLSIYGRAEISRDPKMIDELWDATMKTWFTEGKDDPRITVIKVIPTEGYYWDVKTNMLVAMAKRLYGSVVGETYDDSVEGKIVP
ncbi:pyridoxamine 5'-phosphate oxidase family protein [Flavobacterium sp.]|uniref:pyridoxamine 5'-phosphate oxidase family protein n=1 Tax=Flavobacterium sp. TaxID=239 RepID=UPI00122BE9B1|nr:pyridoxamine 5'-phosphate oxidase family protein [Flavobacterium sp.]RZJ72843.1 MAG: general stress protein [Flavobacterium sp.]